MFTIRGMARGNRRALRNLDHISVLKKDILFHVPAMNKVGITKIVPLAGANDCNLLLMGKVRKSTGHCDCFSDADTFMQIELAGMIHHSSYTKSPAAGMVAVLSR
jgi:hypothetical protein